MLCKHNKNTTTNGRKEKTSTHKHHAYSVIDMAGSVRKREIVCKKCSESVRKYLMPRKLHVVLEKTTV